ncbi:MAG: hypothetical protein EBR82_67960 [Caulobacteraceae bacterium]|nr:hypothetical protein [Caulobacteraceae bacterium]
MAEAITLPIEVEQTIREMHSRGETVTQISRATGIPYTTLDRRMKALGLSTGWSRLQAAKASGNYQNEDYTKVPLYNEDVVYSPPIEHNVFSLPRIDMPAGDDYLRLSGDYLLLSDLHIPYHDPAFIEKAVRTAQRDGIRKFVIIGDTMDANQFSKRGKQLGIQRSWQDDVIIAEAVYRALLGVFDLGVVLLGNHDAWYESHYRGLIDPAFMFPRVFQTGERITFSRYEQAEVVSGGRAIRLLHGANYSAANPLGVAQTLCAKFEQTVAMGHQHHACSGRSRSGKHQAICLGGCYDVSKMSYLHVSPRTNPVQTRSFGILQGGIIRHYIEGES